MASNTKSRKRVVVAMSGGVDSAVAAALVARQGYEVIGVTMRLFNAPNQQAARLNRSCCSIEDVQDARDVCRAIGARHLYLNFEKEFRQHVVEYFVSEYERGRTPYPCLACNDRLKFHFLMERARLLDAELVATGHYARVVANGTKFKLMRAVDRTKDQSYVLYSLRQSQLARLLLPIGDISKNDVRGLAREMGLTVADKPDSQDICFIPDGDYREFIGPRIEQKRPGRIADAAGNMLGTHEGVHMFTIGQRKGVPLPGGSGRPLFVTGIHSESGTVTVGPAEDLLRKELCASGVNWISGQTPVGSTEVSARVRYRGAEELAVVVPMLNKAGESTGWARIEFARPQRAVTPGQAVVFYRGEEVLGGGYIEPGSPDDFGESRQVLAGVATPT